jgi:HNH endonuclease
MILELGYFGSATLDHIRPEPAGCKKRDNDDNLRAVRYDCNSDKGSKRI